MRRLVQIATLIGLVTWSLERRAKPCRRPVATSSSLPWMNTTLTPEQRADLLIPHMTLEQKVQQLSNDTRPC